MNSNISRSVISGVAGTAVMTAIMFIGPMMGMPKMNPAEMLSSMSGMPVAAGWVMHFMIGIVFAAAYVYLFSGKVKIGNRLLKGAAFGLAVFIFFVVKTFQSIRSQVRSNSFKIRYYTYDPYCSNTSRTTLTPRISWLS